MAKQAYECVDCGKQVVREKAGSAPDCCGKPMKEIPLESCTKAGTPEQARNNDADEACDDFVR
jgi:hypothetical protein